MLRRSYFYWLTPLVVLTLFVGGMKAAPQAVVQVTPAATESAEIPPTLTFGPGTFNLQPAAGLSELSGYQASLKVDFKGKESGQASQWTETYELLVSTNPNARTLTAAFKGKAPAAEYVPLWSAAMDGVFYQRGADDSCIATVITERTAPEMTSPVWEPANFLPDVFGAEDAGNKKVNGVNAIGYKFDERALGATHRAKATGEVWVAKPGGYVVKFNLTITGDAAYFGEGGEGKLTWDYNVTKADQPAPIKLLKDCPLGLVKAGVLENAQNVERYPGVTLYKTPSTIVQVVEFYQKNLPSTGWKASFAPIVQENLAVLNFTQGTSQLTVYITADKNETVVRLLLDSLAQ